MTSVQIKELQTPKDIDQFLNFSREVYQKDPAWVPPIRSDVLKFLKGKGLFFKHCRYRLFAAEEQGRMVAVAAAFYDSNLVRHWNEKVGLVGFFEALPGKKECVQSLFEHLETYLKKHGAEKLWGPFNGSLGKPLGLLEGGGAGAPFFYMAYNPGYYQDYFREAGYAPIKKAIAYHCDLKTSESVSAVKQILNSAEKSEVKIRSLNKNRFEEEMRLLGKLHSETFKDHWGYSPQPVEEFLEIIKPFKAVIDPDLILFAEQKGEPVGFVLSVPDFNPLVREIKGNLGIWGTIRFLTGLKRIKEARVIAVGVLDAFRSQQIARHLIAEVFKRMIRKGYGACEYSYVLEENTASRNVIEQFKGHAYRHYSIYEKELSAHV